MIDYGAIAFKNGKCIQADMFTPMMDMVGWEDNEDDVSDVVNCTPLNLNHNYFAYIGDKDLTVAFYKTFMKIANRYDDEPHLFVSNDERFGYEGFCHWSKWDCWGYTHNKEYYIKVTKRNGYYVCKMKYDGDKYKVYFGHGVDYRLYKKWRIVNYYRTPIFLWGKMVSRIKDKFYDWKYYR